jgi:hypothetical protein
MDIPPFICRLLTKKTRGALLVCHPSTCIALVFAHACCQSASVAGVRL